VRIIALVINKKETLPKKLLIFSFSTNLFFQTFLKFNQQTFRKSLTKNALQLRRKKSFTKRILFS